MRISDWSSDVCSSDLGAVADDRGRQADDRHAAVDIDHLAQAHAARTPARSPTPDTAAANGIYRAAEPDAAGGAGPARGAAAFALCPARGDRHRALASPRSPRPAPQPSPPSPRPPSYIPPCLLLG